MTDVEEVRRTWDAVADRWDARADELAAFTAPVRDELVAQLDPRPDDVVVELAAGTGGLSRMLATDVREVICTDLSPRMVAAARRRAEAAGLDNIRCEVADAQDLQLDDDCVDAVVCQMGFMLMPDPTAALRECRRVLRPGGRLVFSTWGAAGANPWVLLIGGAFLQHGHAVQDDPRGPGGLFSLSDERLIAGALRDAGFDAFGTTPVAVEESFVSFDDYWAFHVETGGPLAAALAGMTDGEVATVRTTCEGFADAFRDGDGYRFPGQALVTVASVRAP